MACEWSEVSCWGGARGERRVVAGWGGAGAKAEAVETRSGM